MQMGDMVAALVKGAEEEENWILAEVVQFNAATNKYEVDDIDEEQKDRHTLSRRRVVPLPLMRANPETDPHALFPKGSVGLYSYFVLNRGKLVVILLIVPYLHCSGVSKNIHL